jgi:hypothetical protein
VKTRIARPRPGRRRSTPRRLCSRGKSGCPPDRFLRELTTTLQFKAPRKHNQGAVSANVVKKPQDGSSGKIDEEQRKSADPSEGGDHATGETGVNGPFRPFGFHTVCAVMPSNVCRGRAHRGEPRRQPGFGANGGDLLISASTLSRGNSSGPPVYTHTSTSWLAASRDSSTYPQESPKGSQVPPRNSTDCPLPFPCGRMSIAAVCPIDDKRSRAIRRKGFSEVLLGWLI